MIYAIIAIEAEESWYVMKMHKLLPKILLANHKSRVSGVFHDLG